MRYTSLFLALASCFAVTAQAGTSIDWHGLLENKIGYGWIGDEAFDSSSLSGNTLNLTIPTDPIRRTLSDNTKGYMRGSALALLFTGNYENDPKIGVGGIFKVILEGTDNSTLSIDMTNNPNAGILVFQKSMGTFKQNENPVPLAMEVRGNVSISGDIGYDQVQQPGIHTTGVGVNSAVLTIHGNLDISLQNMQGKEFSAAELPPPIYTEDIYNEITWQQPFGWTLWDLPVSKEEHFVESGLLMNGITQGYSRLDVYGNVNIDVSGKNGFLNGWLSAPNARTSYNGVKFQNLPFRAGAVVNGNVDIVIDAKNQQDLYGVSGIVYRKIDAITVRESPVLHIAGENNISIQLGNQSFAQTSKVFLTEGAKDFYDHVYGMYLHSVDYQAKATNIDIGLAGTRVGSIEGVSLYQADSGLYRYPNWNVEIKADENAKVNSIIGIDVNVNPGGDIQTVLKNTNIELQALNENYQTNLCGIHNMPKSLVLRGNTIIKVINKSSGQRFAINNDAWTSLEVKGDGLVQIEGDVINYPAIKQSSGKIIESSMVINLNQSGSYLKGAVYSHSATGYEAFSTITLALAENTYWNVLGDSEVGTLILKPNSLVKIGHQENQNTSTDLISSFGSYSVKIDKFRSVARSSLAQGQVAPSIEMDIGHDLDLTKQKSGLLVLHDVDPQANALDLLVKSQAGEMGERSRTLVIDSASDHPLDLQLSQNTPIAGYAEQGAYLYRLATHVDARGTIARNEHYQPHGVEAGDVYYYLAKTQKTGPTADNIVAMATHGATLNQNLMRLTDYRERMSQVSQSQDHGAWVSVKATKDRMDGISGVGFKTENTLATFGLDTQWNDWVWGIGLTYIESDQKTQNVTHLDGDGESVGLNVYATYRPSVEGPFVDVIGSLDRVKTEINGVMGDASTLIAGDYTTYGMGLSVEVGHTLSYGSYFVEPTLEASYYHVKGENFTMNDAMLVQQDDLDSLTVRAGVAVGHQWKDSQNNVIADAYLKGGIKHRFMGKQTVYVNTARYDGDILGTRFYYGMGGNWKVTEQVSLWGSLERESGHNYTQEYEALVGMRYVW